MKQNPEQFVGKTDERFRFGEKAMEREREREREI